MEYRHKRVMKTPIEERVLSQKGLLIMALELILIFALLFVLWYKKEIVMWLYWVLVAGIFLPVLWLIPVKVGLRDGEFYIKRLLKTKVIPVERIKSVRIFTPSPADGKICGIRDMKKRLGWFKSWEAGLYFAYIGNTDECFLVELKPDDRSKERRYVVSCMDNVAMVEALNSAIQER